MMKLCFFRTKVTFESLLAFVLFSSATLGQDEIQMAQELGKKLALDADFVFDRGVLQIAEMAVETSADSPLLYTSKIDLRLFKSEELSAESFHSVVEIASDDRTDTSVAGPPGARIEYWKRLYFKNGAYNLMGPNRAELDVPRLIPPSAGSLRWGSCVPAPFDWPFFSHGSLSKDGFGKNLHRILSGELHDCVRAKMTTDGIVSDWTGKDRKGKGFNRFKFVEERLVLFESYYCPDGYDPNDNEANNGSLLLRTETQWELVDGDPYPSKVISVQYKSPFLSEYTKYEAKIKCFSSSTPEYQQEEKLLKGICEKISHAKKESGDE